jgi:hypothetical protein
MSDGPAPGAPDPVCTHPGRDTGVCGVCGHCDHDVILNGACLYCGSEELDGLALSPKPRAEFIPAERLVRGPAGE